MLFAHASGADSRAAPAGCPTQVGPGVRATPLAPRLRPPRGPFSLDLWHFIAGSPSGAGDAEFAGGDGASATALQPPPHLLTTLPAPAGADGASATALRPRHGRAAEVLGEAGSRTARPPRRSAPGQAGRAVGAAAPNAWSRRPRPTVGHRGCDYCFWLDTLVPIHAPREDEMKNFYKNWLEQQGYATGTVQTQMHRAGRVEECYGNLDEHYDSDQLRRVIDELNYSTDDERKNKPNPSKIPFNGNTRNNLASYRNAVERYCKFRRETQDEDNGSPQGGAGLNESAADRGQLIGLERDLQAALRRAIEQLEPGLEVIDDGAERSVASGFIDITAKDARGAIVVVELKTGTARQGAVAQVLSYMGDIADEEPDLAGAWHPGCRGFRQEGTLCGPRSSQSGVTVLSGQFRVQGRRDSTAA